MQIDLKGLRALVTGSTAGIGEAIAARLAQNGAEVIVNGRTAERVSKAIASPMPAVEPVTRARSPLRSIFMTITSTRSQRGHGRNKWCVKVLRAGSRKG